MTSLVEQFHHAMIRIHENDKEHDYFATYFKRMLNEYKGVETVKWLLEKEGVHEGLIKL